MPALLTNRRRRDTVRVLDARVLIPCIRRAASGLESVPDQDLAHRADDLRAIWPLPTEHPDSDQLTAAFALVVEAARRTLGITLYDVQLLGGLALAREQVAEMKTGEGKTFTTLLPAFVASLYGRGVHIATSNAYLAERDCHELKPVFELLRTSVGLLKRDLATDAKREAYACDVTFGPGYDFGFDYLRDQVTLRSAASRPLGTEFLGRLRGDHQVRQPTMQRRLANSIVDEIDNVLIDDACSPLLLSGDANRPAEDAALHLAARDLVRQLTAGPDYEADHHSGALRLTATGSARLWVGTELLPFDKLRRPWPNYVEQAIRAIEFFRRDVHYVVRDGKIVIVDESTGRLFEERSWRDGLHQAIEAKERIDITSEKIALAQISRQRFARLYERCCGMTGTATGSEAEFREFFNLGVTLIPTHRPNQRRMLPTRYFRSGSAKWAAIAAAVSALHASGQPVLIGTRSIASSEELAALLHDRQVPHQLLNGRQDADEASIISAAGQLGAVTIATNMAGRGTDIKPSAAALSCGGLHVIATELHDSVRIDRQLIGRAARQGEVGSAQFYVSADDDLLRRHGDWFRREMQKLPHRDDEITTDIASPVRRIQAQAERAGFLQRRQLFHQSNARDEFVSRIWK
jgi:preprotein translocase subunit SecA